MSIAPSPLHHDIRQGADGRDGDSDFVGGGEGEVVVGDDAGAGEEEGPVREGVVAAEVVDQVLQRAVNLIGADGAGKSDRSAAADDQFDLHLIKRRQSPRRA